MDPREAVKPVIRTATAADAPVLARLHLQCWRETYSGLLSPAFFARQSVEERLALWQVLVNGPLGNRQFVADLHGELVGFAGSIPAATKTPGAPSGAKSELWGIYLLKAHHGSGLGQKLLEATIGTEPAALWVAEENPRAQAFYRRNGFEFTGVMDPIDDWEGMIQVRMVR